MRLLKYFCVFQFLFSASYSDYNLTDVNVKSMLYFIKDALTSIRTISSLYINVDAGLGKLKIDGLENSVVKLISQRVAVLSNNKIYFRVVPEYSKTSVKEKKGNNTINISNNTISMSVGVSTGNYISLSLAVPFVNNKHILCYKLNTINTLEVYSISSGIEVFFMAYLKRGSSIFVMLEAVSNIFPISYRKMNSNSKSFHFGYVDDRAFNFSLKLGGNFFIKALLFQVALTFNRKGIYRNIKEFLNIESNQMKSYEYSIGVGRAFL